MQHPFIHETLAFSAPNEQYQESIGVIIVPKQGMPRVDLPSLHHYLQDKLHRSKWPQVIVYSNLLPKNATGKVLRIRFAERTKMKTVDEESPPHTRLYEIDCPEIGTPLNVYIPLIPVQRDLYRTFTHLLTKKHVVDVAVVLVNLAQHQSAVVAFIVLDENASQSSQAPQSQQLLVALQESCAASLHQYEKPQYMYQVSEIPYLAPEFDSDGEGFGESGRLSGVGDSSKKHSSSKDVKDKKKSRKSSSRSLFGSPSKSDKQGSHSRDITLVVDTAKLTELAVTMHAQQHIVAPRNPIEAQVELVWRSLLQLNSHNTSHGEGQGSFGGTGSPVLSVTTSFFDMGGDSLKAGQLVNVMRKQLQVHISVADLFTAPTIELMARKIATLKTLGTPDISSMKRSSVHGALNYDTGLTRRKGGQNDKTSRPRSSSAVGASTGGGGTWTDQASSKYGAVGAAGANNKTHTTHNTSTADDVFSVHSDDSQSIDPYFSWDFAPSLSSTSLGCLFIQALPVLLIYPLRRIVIWFLIAAPWVYFMKLGWGR